MRAAFLIGFALLAGIAATATADAPSPSADPPALLPMPVLAWSTHGFTPPGRSDLDAKPRSHPGPVITEGQLCFAAKRCDAEPRTCLVVERCPSDAKLYFIASERSKPRR